MNGSINNNRIDLARIYGLNRSDNANSRSKSMNVQPPSLEQIAASNNLAMNSNANNENAVNSVNNINSVNYEQNNPESENMNMAEISAENNPELEKEVDLETCARGRCRFAPSSVEPFSNTEAEGDNNFCPSCRKNDFMPITEYNQPYPINASNIQYLNGFIRSQVGRRVHVEFLIGTNNIVEKDGYLVAVGANFILLNPLDTTDILACDFYNIKFMKFYY
ncbi:MAG: hypothetical protein ACI4GV_09140 [Acutalibacteraceae bacterium]